MAYMLERRTTVAQLVLSMNLVITLSSLKQALGVQSDDTSLLDQVQLSLATNLKHARRRGGMYRNIPTCPEISQWGTEGGLLTFEIRRARIYK